MFQPLASVPHLKEAAKFKTLRPVDSVFCKSLEKLFAELLGRRKELDYERRLETPKRDFEKCVFVKDTVISTVEWPNLLAYDRDDTDAMLQSGRTAVEAMYKCAVQFEREILPLEKFYADKELEIEYAKRYKLLASVLESLQPTIFSCAARLPSFATVDA